MIQPIKTGGDTQLDLFYRRLAREESLDQRFATFHEQNPEIYRLCRGFALQALHAGHKTYSMDAIFHRVRWHMDIETKSQDPFKLNNNHTSRYARLLMDNEPELDGFFEIRVLRGR